MATIIHKNNWRWGRGDIIVISDGRGLCTVSVENDNPAVAYLSGVSVWEPVRGYGLGNDLLNKAKEHAREMGAKKLVLWVDPNDWPFEWYKRNGFIECKNHVDGLVQMEKEL